MSTEVGALHYDLDIDKSKLKGQLDSADNDVKGFGQKMEQHFGGAVAASAKFAAGVAVAGVAAVAFGVSSVKAFSEAEGMIAQTNAVLKSTGSIAGVTAEQIDEMSKALQRQTTYSDEDVRSVSNLLLTFTSIGKDVFPQATATVLDMSVALGQDTKSSAVQLGKALQDPINGITALRRVGVNFTEAQKTVIENLVNTGKTAEAQKLILKELNTEFGGSAVAQAKTFSGAMKQIGNQLNDVQEIIGGVIVKALQPLATAFANWMEKAGGAEGVIKKLTDVFSKLKPFIPAIVGAIVGGLIPAFVALGIAIWTALAPIVPFLLAGAAIGLAVNWIAQQFGGWGVVLQAVGGFFKEMWAFISEMLMPSLTALWNTIQTTLMPLFREIADILGPHVKEILMAIAIVMIGPFVLAVIAIVGALWLVVNVVNVVIQVISTLIDITNRVYQAIWNFGKAIVTAFVDANKWLYNAGRDLIQGMINGVKDMIGQLVNTVKGAANSAVGAVKGVLGIHSPSTVFMGIGKNVTEGFIQGINSSADMAINAMGNLGNNIIAPVMNPVMAGGAASGGSNTNIGGTTINIGTIQDRQDADYILNKQDRMSNLESMGMSPARQVEEV